MGNVSGLWRLLGFLVTASFVLMLLFKTRWGRSIFVQCQDVRQEVARMHWPTRQETIQTTVATLAMVLVMGLILWTADFVLLRAVKWLTGHWGV
ncbi:MAG: preprotein translocase subunit SecE [Gammaproteobacteria bacterium]|nr:preprotein translocase subunit SecE [Gammaproteobacteria bacterium]